MSFAAQLIETCDIERLTATGTSDYGHKTGTWGSLAADVACLMQVRNGREVRVGDQAVISNHVLFLAVQDVTERDRVLHGGVLYDVLLVRNPGGQNHHLELDLLRVKE